VSISVIWEVARGISIRLSPVLYAEILTHETDEERRLKTCAYICGGSMELVN